MSEQRVIDDIPWALTKGEDRALRAMPTTGYVKAKRGTPFNGQCMWQLHLKGFVETPDAGANPTSYRMTAKARRLTQATY